MGWDKFLRNLKIPNFGFQTDRDESMDDCVTLSRARSLASNETVKNEDARK